MTEPSLIHHTFAIERRYAAPIDEVFAAWSDPKTKRRWFTGDKGEHSLDFRVGGLEVLRVLGANGKMLAVESRYVDIIDSRRIVYVTTLSADDELATTSITTVELHTDSGDTVLLLTESDVFLDGQEQPAWREQGTGDWLTKLGDELQTAVR
jgi:uncharacterized protein YndB with AHSA1/START domain